jgi:hypothetical protein
MMDITIMIAIYGAILSTIAIVWNIYNNLQDRPKIEITARFGFFGSSTGAEGPFFFVDAINHGKRSIYLSSVGLRGGKEDLVSLKSVGLPCELKAGQSHSEWFEIEKLRNRRFDFAWYKDATGKTYKSRSISKKLENYFKSKKEEVR